MNVFSTTAWLLGAGLLAGAMNAVAGGGTFVTLPALVLAGVPSVTANASSTVALFPGGLASTWAYRADLSAPEGVSLRALVGVSLAGGFVGALLLLLTPRAAFDRLLPWLLLMASGVFALGPRVGGALHQRVRVPPATRLVLQFLLALYGGYFGGAVGIMMMAVWSLLGASDLKVLNPLKTLMVTATNAIAGVCFVALGAVSWPETLVLLGASVVGGYAGARLARRLDSRHLRLGVTGFSLLLTLAYFLRSG
jgi:uncharacterized membrane protein YfcA